MHVYIHAIAGNKKQQLKSAQRTSTTQRTHPSPCNVILILLHSSCAILVLICILIPVPVRLGMANPLLT